jgi:hypothetical protein
MADDSGGSAASAYGLQGFPYFIATDGEGKVLMRGSGELTEGDMARIITTLQGPAT